MKSVLFQLAASIVFFTRIPLWRVVAIPSESFSKIIVFWPLTGWIIGGVTAATWYGLSFVFPHLVALILALAVRTLLTGAMHEDGLSDFFDGFGGAHTKQDILRIMKDSQVGSYALMGMLFYYSLLLSILFYIPQSYTALVIFVANPLSKMFSVLIMNFLPYARDVSDSKAKMILQKPSIAKILFLLVIGLSPFFYFFSWSSSIILIAPLVLSLLLYLLLHSKIGGYTGDTCGASALLCELIIYLSFYVYLS